VAVRRGLVLVIAVIAFACAVSASGLFIVYLLFNREPVVASGSTLVIRLSGEIAEGGPEETPLFGARRLSVRTVVENLRKASRDSRIAGVLLAPSGMQAPYWAKLQEMRDAIIEFRRSGKPAVAYLEYGSEQEYYLATGCDRIYLVPSSPLDLSGTAMYEVFLRETLDKMGAVPDMLHIGEYKTATNQLTQKDFTPAHREMDESLNNDLFSQLVQAVAVSRKKSPAQIRALANEGPFLPEDALRAGLVDDLAYEDQISVSGTKSKPGPRIGIGDYSRVSERALGLGTGPRIAVLYASGVIASGASGYDPMAGSVVGSQTLIDSIRSIREDPSIKAIVLRIDSPGGSSVASDVVWRELAITRDRTPGRPLVASMSDLAASGGYYIAVAAPTIVAEPATLTGSIGIYGGKIAIGATLAKIGVTHDSVAEGRNAEMDSPFEPFTPEQHDKLKAQLQTFYDQFVEKVAQSRHMTPEQVDAIGQGRVWTGQQAKELGLVDNVGGLEQAIALAKQQAKIPAQSSVQILIYPPRRSLFDILSSQLFSSSRVAVPSLGGIGGRAAGILAAPAVLFRRGEPLALMPALLAK
jgi:protease-4